MIRHPIKTAEPRDAEEIQALEKRCFGPVDVFPIRRWRRLLRSSTTLGIVVRSPHGWILASAFGLLRHFRIPSARVYKIAIDPSLRGLGLGSRLLRAIEERFRRAGMRRVCAEVRESNQPSRGLFLKNGYRESGSLPGYYDDGENGIKFWKNL